MAWFLILTMAVLCIVFLIFVIQIPIFIAKGRGITGSDLTTIIVLSWLGILLGVTWLVALVLSLVWPRVQISVSRCKGCGAGDVAEQLEKLHKLKQKGIISQKEFDAEKKRLLG